MANIPINRFIYDTPLLIFFHLNVPIRFSQTVIVTFYQQDLIYHMVKRTVKRFLILIDEKVYMND